jgi:hypothetical protein
VDTGTGCEKPSYGRGAGKIPKKCPPGQVNDAGLCYPECRENYKGVGPVCWGNCPEGFKDDGAFCAKDTIDRGVGTVPPFKLGWIFWVIIGIVGLLFIGGIIFLLVKLFS